MATNTNKVNLGYRFRLYPNEKQKTQIDRTIGSCRFLWNNMLSDKITHYKTTGKTLKNKPTDYKNTYPFLKEVDSLALCNVQQNLEGAYERFFRTRKGFPKFKSKKKALKESYKTNVVGKNIRIIDNSHIQLPKLGSVRFKKHREPIGIIKNATITKTKSGKYYVSLCTENTNYVNPRPPSNNKRIGLDLGIKDLYTDSEGNVIENPKFYNKNLEKLRKLYREVSRKVKDSKNRKKSNKKIAKLSEHISNSRKDYLHKVSTRVINENQVICLETLSVTGMMKNKSKAINRNISDTGLYFFISCLLYKARLYEREIYLVNKYFPSSQKCHGCGHIEKSVKNLSIRVWTCPQCGQVNLRDYNAALNIRDNANIKVV